MTISLPSFSRIFSTDNAIRRLLMIVLALVMTHLISYQKLPFSSNYHFPFIPFSIFVIYGIFICEVNSWNYRKLSTRYGHGSDFRNTKRIVQVNLLACTIIFIVLTFAQMVIFQYAMNPFRFAGLLGVCLMISLIETGVFVVMTLIREKNRAVTFNRIASEKKELTILRNDELITFSEEQVAFMVHQDGCVFLIDKAGQRFTTQFESLGEVEVRLSDQFFRATRQTLVSRSAIYSLKKDVNGKIKLGVTHLSEPLTVSRYKSRELKEWYKG